MWHARHGKDIHLKTYETHEKTHTHERYDVHVGRTTHREHIYVYDIHIFKKKDAQKDAHTQEI